MTTGPDSPGFKSRPLYRRTGSSRADGVDKEDQDNIEKEDSLVMSGIDRRGIAPSASRVIGLRGKASGAKFVGHNHEEGAGTAQPESVDEDDGEGGGDTGDERGYPDTR